jgi:hypothetical protein
MTDLFDLLVERGLRPLSEVPVREPEPEPAVDPRAKRRYAGCVRTEAGIARHKETSAALKRRKREDEGYRLRDNAKRAAHWRERYATDEEFRLNHLARNADYSFLNRTWWY